MQTILGAGGSISTELAKSLKYFKYQPTKYEEDVKEIVTQLSYK